jgi:hypothetical protein
MSEFQLVNPLIGGNLNTKFTSEKSLEAASQAYNTLSQYFKKDVPSFNFTLKDKENKFYHFNVKENLQGNEVSFKIKEFKIKSKGNKDFTNFKKKLTSFDKLISQKGGDYDIFDDDEDYYFGDNDFFPRKISRSYYYGSPISHYWYWPSIYDYVIGDSIISSSYYLPTFVDLLSPYYLLFSKIP